MQPRPTPTSPRFIHRFNPPPPPNIPLLVVTAFIAAILTVLVGSVVLRLTERTSPTNPTPGASQPVRSFERVRELRASAAVEFLGSDGSPVANGIAVSNDGWLVTVATPSLPSDVVARAAAGTTAAVATRVADPATSALFVNVDAQFDTVPLGSAEDRFIGETVALVSPGAVPRVDIVSPATVVAPHALATGGGVQRSDASPSVFLIEAVTAPRAGTPVFSLSGDLLGLTLAPEASGRVPVLPAWLLNRAVSEVLGGRALPRSGLGLLGRPAEVVAAGTAGFVVVTAARGSVGERAGIAVGDVIERVDDDPVTVDEPLADLLLPHRPGDRVTLRVRSGDTDRSVDVVLGNVGP